MCGLSARVPAASASPSAWSRGSDIGANAFFSSLSVRVELSVYSIIETTMLAPPCALDAVFLAVCAAAFSVQAHAAAGAVSWEDKLFMAPDDFAEILWGLASIKAAANTVRHVHALP